MRTKILALLQHLNHGLVDREPALKAALLTVLAGENIVLIGPPGTGKSLLARRIAEGLGGGEGGLSYFEYLLTKFSTPEELFGPLSITALKSDRFHRNTAGYLPQVELAFLDEVFKASSSILNALLTLMNERIFHNGADREAAPLRAVIAASNELPTGQEELAALYDRFLLRSFVDYVRADHLPHLLAAPVADSAPPLAERITAQDMQRLQAEAQTVTLPPDVAQALQDIWHQHRETFKEDRREQLSDRRLMKCLNLLRVSAATNGRTEVDLSDVLLLKDCLWSHPDNTGKVVQLVLDMLRRHSRPVPLSQPLLLADGSPAPSQSQAYEVDSDGTTLVPVTGTAISRTSASRAVAPAHTSSRAVGQMNAVVKGFCGSGTEQDPLLVQSVEDLMDLARPEVGMQGYYFRQTKDIDCSSFNAWMDIDFQGIFDGGNFTITGFVKNNSTQFLFKKIDDDSIVKNLRLINLGVANSIENTKIHHSMFSVCAKNLEKCQVVACSSSDIFCESAENSTFAYCSSGSCFINGSSNFNKFNSCSATYSFFGDSTSSCEIKDCAINLNSKSENGLTDESLEECIVERCFIFGRNYDSGHSLSGGSGFASEIYGGYIKNSVLGEIWKRKFNYIISDCIGSTQLIGNYSLDSNYRNDPGKDKNGSNAQAIPSAMFTQRFFENHLDWDFENVWYWDNANNQPALRHAGVDAQPPALSAKPTAALAAPTAQDVDMEDLLTRQVQSNIWL